MGKRLKKKRTNAKIKEKNEKTVQQKKRRVFEAATEKKAKEDRKVEAKEHQVKQARRKAILAKKEKFSKDLKAQLKKYKEQLAERKDEEKRSKSQLANLEEMTGLAHKRVKLATDEKKKKAMEAYLDVQ